MEPEAFGTLNPDDVYAQMRPDQRTVIAGEFIRLLTIAGDPEAERLRQETEAAQENALAEASTQAAGNGNTDEQPVDDGATPASQPVHNPARVPAEQVSRLHTYTREHHPDIFEQVMSHPVTVASLARPGAAEHEDGTQAEQPAADQPRPDQPPNELTEPAMAERATGSAGGIESDRLIRTPNERGARPFEDEGGDTLIRPEPVGPEEQAEPEAAGER